MSAKLTAAGYDPSSIEERARVIAKARGLIGENRKRSAGDMDMDEGEDDGEGWADEDSMEVDADARGSKRSKTSIVAQGKRVPGTDRQTAGLGDASVRHTPPLIALPTMLTFLILPNS